MNMDVLYYFSICQIHVSDISEWSLNIITLMVMMMIMMVLAMLIILAIMTLKTIFKKNDNYKLSL